MNKIKYTLFVVLFCFCLVNGMLTACGGSRQKPPQEHQKPLPEVVEPPAPDVEPEPILLPEEVPAAKEQLGSHKTDILDMSEGRVHNLKLASEKISKSIVQPGEVFSFNQVVGKAEAEKGFKDATVIKKNKRVIDEGGGVCQVSSTLFNAAEQAGMKIVERHSHSRDVGYIPQGRDAAIAYGGEDLKFKNVKSFPISIDAKIDEGNKEVVVSIYKAAD